MTDEQIAAVDQLQEAMGEFATALARCHDVGLEPADAFRAAGVEIPSFAAPLLNAQFASLFGLST